MTVFLMAGLMYMFIRCKICFTVYTGETKINDTYLTYLL